LSASGTADRREREADKNVGAPKIVAGRDDFDRQWRGAV
jgi:hypothetical protein